MIAIFQVYRAFPLCDHQAVTGGQWKADMNVIYNNVHAVLAQTQAIGSLCTTKATRTHLFQREILSR